MMKKNKKSKKEHPYVKWFFVHVLNHKVLFTLNFIGIVSLTYLRTMIPVQIGNIIDSIIQRYFLYSLLVTMLILLGYYLLRNAVEYATWMIGHQLGSKTEQSMRKEFFETVHNKPLSFHDKIKTGDLEALATNDLRVVNTLIAHGSFYIYPFVQTVVILIQIQTFNYWMALLTVPFLGIYIYFVLRYRKQLLPYSKASLRKHADVAVALQESLNSVQVTKAFCAEEVEYSKFKQAVQAFRNNRLGEIRIQARFFPLLTLYAAIGTSLVFGAILISYNLMSVGHLTAVILLFITLINPTQMIFWATRDMIRGFGASERLFNIISTGEAELAAKSIGIDISKPLQQISLKGEIKFQNVSFTYPNGNPKNPQVLKNLTFSIKPNQRVALVGPTGCGKTTLAKLLLRFYDPQEGTILLDDEPIQNFPLEQVRQRISLVEQDIYLFSQTIEE